MGHGSSQLDDLAPELSVSYLDVLEVRGKMAEPVGSRSQSIENCEDIDAECQEVQSAEGCLAGDPGAGRHLGEAGAKGPDRSDASVPRPLRSSAESECSTAAPSEDEGDVDVRTLGHDLGLVTPLLGVAEDASESDTEVPLPVEKLRDSTHIIFDWDDTLLPTSFIMDAVKICPPKYGAALTRRDGPRRGHVRVGGKLSKDFPCFEALQSHAARVERLLTSASRLARVAIVTSASRPWVFESADQYLPGLNFAGLLKELEVPVYYAHEHSRSQEPEEPELDLAAACKRSAMAEFLQQASQDGAVRNVVSIGDSQAEKDAAKALARRDPLVLPSSPRLRSRRPLCKTVKLMADPSLKHLSEELRLLTERLETVACHNGDLDLCITEPEDLTTQVDALITF